MAKKQETIENVVVCPGAVISNEVFQTKENRLLTLLLKGFIVYLLSMGSIGFYLSAFEIAYNALLCHVVIFLMSMCCAMLYYRLLYENLGYLLLLVIFAALVFNFRDYINSGFYAIINITVENASQYFDVDIQRLYNERIGNRYVTVTFVALFIGIVLDILLNVYISRRMQYVTACFIIMVFNLIPLYLVEEPDLFYVIMMLGGISMAVVYKAGRHYSPQVSIKRDDTVYKLKEKKHEISYVYDVKSMIQAGIFTVVFCMIVAVLVSTVRPKERFNTGYQVNKYKDISMEAISILLVDGISGFYRQHKDVGGLNSGELGTVSSVRVDNQPDLSVQMTPYSTKTIYLKSFVGVQYNPYKNIWTGMDEMDEYENVSNTPEAEALRDAFEDDYPGCAKGLMKIRNVGVPDDQMYLPYYSLETEFKKGSNYITYYPRLAHNGLPMRTIYYEGEPYQKEDLYVPEENQKAVSYIVNELGEINSNDEAVFALADYFQEQYPYTVRPGKTPKKKDFINYFVLENQKGYCAHYASTAVLVFRSLGIPARYVEGYAFGYNQILNGTMVEDKKYEDYYQGSSELGQTAVIDVTVTDADAHAWVEIYDEKLGWYPVDVTPESYEDDIEDVNFWDEFENFMGDGEENASEITDGQNGFAISDEVVKKSFYIIGLLFAGFLLIVFGKKGIHGIFFLIRYRRANKNDKLILCYQRIVQKKKKDKEFQKLYCYETQLEYLISCKEKKNPDLADSLRLDKTRVVSILQEAGFSNHLISDESYDFAVEYLKKCQ